MEHSLCEKKGQRAVSYRKCVGGWKKYGRADRIKMQMLAWQVVSERAGRQAVLAVVVVVGGWRRMMIVDCELTRDRTSFVSSAAAAWTTERTNEWRRQKTHSRTTGPGECKSN